MRVLVFILFIFLFGPLSAAVFRLHNGQTVTLRKIRTPYKSMTFFYRGILVTRLDYRLEGNIYPLMPGMEVAYNAKYRYLTKVCLRENARVRIGDNSFVFNGGSEVTFTAFSNWRSKGIYVYPLSAILAKNVRMTVGKHRFLVRRLSKIAFLGGNDWIHRRFKVYVKGLNLHGPQSVKVGRYRIRCQSTHRRFGYDIDLDSRGRITSLFLETDHTLTVGARRIRFGAGTRLGFREGRIIFGTPYRDIKIALKNTDMMVHGGRLVFPTLSFYENGRISALTLARTVVYRIHGLEIYLAGRHSISLTKDERIRTAILARPLIRKHNGRTTTIEKDRMISFDRTGRITKVW